jgi:hypothetical protein
MKKTSNFSSDSRRKASRGNDPDVACITRNVIDEL